MDFAKARAPLAAIGAGSLAAMLATVLNPAGILVREVFPGAGEDPDFAGLLLASLAHGAALAWLASHTHLRGPSLAVAVGGLYAATTGGMAQIESWVFLSLWNPVLTGPQIARILIHQTTQAALVGALAALFFHRAPVDPALPGIALHRGPSLAWRLGAVAALYVPIYLLAGAFIAMPLAGGAFDEVYGALQVPAWMPLFQLARGLAWAGLAWLLLRLTRGGGYSARTTVALGLAIPMDAGLLLRNPIFPDALRRAHLVEVGVSMLVFGWLAAGLLTDRGRTEARSG